MPQLWQTSRFLLDLQRPLVMGIVNVTPDSFSDGGRHAQVSPALAHAELLLRQGAHILDIGGESTRPGSPAVPLDEELRRVMPLVREAVKLGVPVSVDTYKPGVMRVALAAGVSMINDISGLRSAEARAAVVDSDCAVCLMHMQGEPATMQDAPVYEDVVREVSTWLQQATEACVASGIARGRLVLDPGFGFGKDLGHNLALFRALSGDLWQGLPLLVGVSRKRMLGEITGRPVTERVYASVAAALLAAQRGAAILRVHDVAATCDALKVWQAVKEGERA